MRDERIVVIADDITGAAEMAGIALSNGRPVRLVCGTAATDTPAGGVTVIATDTRSMTAAEAVGETRHLAGRMEAWKDALVFKKTDSALRGHVVAELSALMELTGYRRAVYLPANPSKGRIISDGVYRIHGTPIHETDFSFDPEFPARTSILNERFPDAEAHGIIMPDAGSEADIRRVIAAYADGRTLFAGAADLFTALLLTSTTDFPIAAPPPSACVPFSSKNGACNSTLILCGSTQSRALDLGIPVAPMPASIYDGGNDLSQWDTTAYDSCGSLILNIPHTHRTGKTVAVHLRTVMAAMTQTLVARRRPDQLIIEGGATAWAVLNALGWTLFCVERQVAPGVVQMRAEGGTLVTLKPGSYPWGGLFT